MASAAVIARQQLIWRDPPVWPFVWRGALPLAALALVALVALFPFAHNSIQATVEHEVRAQLNEAGFSWVGLSASGQSVKLAGVEPASGDGARALAIARTATCPTWLGRYTCAVSVTGSFMPPPVAAVPEAPPAAPAAAVAAPATPRPAAAPALPLTRQGCESSLAGLLANEQIEFASGSARIDAKSTALLDRLAREVKSCPGSIRIEGYTDTVGRGRLNQRLSAERAAAVRAALIARGIPASRLSAKGYGARHAIADNATEAGRARNRRIEFHTLSAK
jgi:outer membrane protein OmpA-like peptidoglycan-associated protein